MKRLPIGAIAFILLVVAASPVAAGPPTINLEVHPQTWLLPNPCADVHVEIEFEGTSTIREIVRDGQPRITAVTHTITGPDPWSGRGTDSGVELTQGENLSFQIMFTNSETDERFRFSGRGHFNANTGQWNTVDGGLFTLECVRR